MASNQVERLATIEAALRDASQGDFAEVGAALLKVLGYSSERTIADQTGDVGGFLNRYPRLGPDGRPVASDAAPTQDEMRLREHARSVHILFQYTDDDIPKQVAQGSLLADETFAYGHQRSFLFVSAELSEESYNRGRYASFTREINRRFPGIPAVVLFRTSNGQITLAFVHRRANKRDENRDVLGTVSLVREINPVDAHRAHLDILGELSLDERLKWIDDHRDQRNFDGLLRAWLDALDTEELNKRFYRELKTWFDRAIKEASFPTGVPKEQPAERHAIRLITRLLFVWFIKEKHLVADELFIEKQVRELLKDYDGVKGDSYYRAILQNLFFATLNTPIEDRGFSEGTNKTHRNFNRYRYRYEIGDKDSLLGHFGRTPFINGGLFECLDSEEAAHDGGWRIDYFSDNVSKRGTTEFGRLSIPNRLFFDQDSRNPGLITLFNRYKFTVEENTPAEQEVALDPELLGKVFENLLASINEDASDNARRQSGSYYTPRPVVDYMVDEALVAALLPKLAPDGDPNDWWGDRLHFLFDYADGTDAAQFFGPNEIERLVRAISELRVLDPAVGSGAFPMGVLHKLTLALRRLDPDNSLWVTAQHDVASRRADDALWRIDREARDEELQQISEFFERYGLTDFGRKLYLIQNTIFGVDIDPNATEIAKLRFFISLAIEQEPTKDPAHNFGIRPLPNLETRFVTADSLLRLEKPTQPLLNEHVEEIERTMRDLAKVREKHFHSGSRQEKLRLRTQDRILRQRLARIFEQAQFPPADARKIADWDPMDQSVLADASNAADWFDPQFTYGIPSNTFDIVISNPPYAQLQKNGGRLGNLYKGAGYVTFEGRGDIYQLFYERGFGLLADGGILAYITSNSWLRAESGKGTRRHISDRHTVLRLIELGKDVFESVIVDTGILVVRGGSADVAGRALDMDRLAGQDLPTR